MMDKMDTDKDGQLSERELFSALHHPEMGVRDIVSRMVVKHESEWFGGSGHQKWTAFFQDCDTLRIDIAKKWLDDMEWMSRVEPFTSGKAVWHMHPVMFLDAIGAKSQSCITVDMIYKVFEGLRSPAKRLGNGNVASGDGSRYCGRGGVHLTGKVNYEGFSDYYKTQWNDGVDVINNPSVIENPVYCVRSAVYFWLRENLYLIADAGNTGVIVNKIAAKVNLHTDSYAKRRKHFEDIMNKKIFEAAFQ